MVKSPDLNIGVISPLHYISGKIPDDKITLNNLLYTFNKILLLAFIISFFIRSEKDDLLLESFLQLFKISISVII